MAHAPPPATIEHLAPELLTHVISFLPSARDLCRAASVNSTWARRVKDNEDVLWKPMVARRWRSLPQLGISARRQYMLMATSFQQQRIAANDITAEYEFTMEVVLGDNAPTIAPARLSGGWFSDDGHERDRWGELPFPEMPIAFAADFPQLQLQEAPYYSDRLTYEQAEQMGAPLPKPVNDQMEVRVFVKRRSDHAVAEFLAITTHLRLWKTTVMYGFDDEGTGNIPAASLIVENCEVLPTPRWLLTDPTAYIVMSFGRWTVEANLWWAGSLERWGGENANELRINGLMKCFYPRGYEAQYAVGPRRLEMSLEDVLRILRAPRVDPGGGLRWV